jgi:hypothetical protein
MISISKDGKYVNLWDLLTEVTPISKNDGVCQGVLDMLQADRDQGQKVKELLNSNSRWGGQEFCLHVDDGAWRIEVFSCYDERSEPLLRLIIPKDGDKPVRVETRDATVEVVVPERKEVVTP